MEVLTKALADMEKLLKSKKTEFVAGPRGLQARRALAIQSHLKLVVSNNQLFVDASEMAAETHGFAQKWGGRQLRSWTRNWAKTRQLPKSAQGKHAKVYLLLSDPAIATELRTCPLKQMGHRPEKACRVHKEQACSRCCRQISPSNRPRGNAPRSETIYGGRALPPNSS
jgi:hypothetical protein